MKRSTSERASVRACVRACDDQRQTMPTITRSGGHILTRTSERQLIISSIPGLLLSLWQSEALYEALYDSRRKPGLGSGSMWLARSSAGRSRTAPCSSDRSEFDMGPVWCLFFCFSLIRSRPSSNCHNRRRLRVPLRACMREGMDKGCDLTRRCAAFLDSLGLDPVFFDQQYNRCYCGECVDAGCIPDILESRSKHGFPYEVPKGWCGFGLQMPPRARARDLNCFEDWAVSYHGCPTDVVASVLNHGGLMMPGDCLMDGTMLPNRLTGGDEHRIGIYTSPSIRYSELDIYTKPTLWNGTKVRIVFQCRQDMKTKFPALRIEGETIGWEYRFGPTPISRYFSNSEIERYTNARATIIPYRILVGIDSITRWAEEEEKAGEREVGIFRENDRVAQHGPSVELHAFGGVLEREERAKQEQERKDAEFARALQQQLRMEDEEDCTDASDDAKAEK